MDSNSRHYLLMLPTATEAPRPLVNLIMSAQHTCEHAGSQHHALENLEDIQWNPSITLAGNANRG